MRTLPLVLGTALLALSGCTLNTDYFGDYRGKNILSNYDFNALEADGTTPKWALVVDATTQAAAIAAGQTYSPSNYMTWEDVGNAANPDHAYDVTAGTPATGPSGSKVYRIEIKNLIPNGDFENAVDSGLVNTVPTGLGPEWTLTGSTYLRLSTAHPDNGAPTPQSLPTGGSNIQTIDHRSLLFAANAGAGDYLKLALDTALGSPLWLPNQYRIRFDFANVTNGTSFEVSLIDRVTGNLPGDNLSADKGGDWKVDLLSTLNNPPLVITPVSRTFTVSSTTDQRTLRLGSASNADGAIIDNVRLMPAVSDLSVTASLPSLTSGSIQLLPGTKSGAYIFTLRILDDPTADQTSLNHAPNRFHPNGLTVTIRGRAKNAPDTILLQQFVARPVSGWPIWTTLTLKGGLDFVDSDAELSGAQALRLFLSPTDSYDLATDGKDIGSLLISEPSLTFNP